MSTGTTGTKAHRVMIEHLAAARLRSGLSQQETAKKLGRSQTWIARVESGNRRIDVIEFLQLTRVFGVSPRGLIAKMSRDLR